MKKQVAGILGAGIAIASLLLAPENTQAQTDEYDHHSCFVWGMGSEWCHNTGYAANAHGGGCQTDFRGHYRFAWMGADIRGRVMYSFTMPFHEAHYYVVDTPQHIFKWRLYDAGQSESGPWTVAHWTTREGFHNPPSWIWGAYLECCTCKTKSEAQVAMLRHMQTYARKHDLAVDDPFMITMDGLSQQVQSNIAGKK